MANLRQEWSKPRPPTPVDAAAAQQSRDDRPIGDDEPAYWSEIALFRAAGRNRPVVVFRRAAWRGDGETGSLQGLITRELVRQGLIMATREATDAVVRDRAAGDPDEPGMPDAILRLGSMVQSSRNRPPDVPLGARITIAEGSGPARRVLLHRRLDVITQEAPYYNKLVGQIERLVRAEFRAALADWKLPPTRAPQPAVDLARLPDGVAGHLRSLSEFDQVAALRALHDAVRLLGGSAPRCQALARGYAVLGSLVEPLPSAGHAVFKARALLYAQQAVVAEHDSPASLRAQALTEALAGLTQEAKYDAALAEKADGGKGATPLDEATRAFLALNPAALQEIIPRMGDDPLALYLRAVAAARTLNRSGEIDHVCRNEFVAAQDDVLKQVPDCYRAIDNRCEASGVANLHECTTMGLELFAAATSRRVAMLPGLPPAVAAQAEQNAAGADEVALRHSLDLAAAGDPSDLSWGAVAQILRETRFWQVCRRIHFESIPLGSSPRDFAIEARPMVADHPNREFLDLFTGQLDQAHGARVVRQLDLDGLERKNAYPLLFIVRHYDPGLDKQLWKLGDQHADLGLVVNLEWILRSSLADFRAIQAKQLLQFDPGSPVARAALVATDWASAAPRIAAWEREQPWNTPFTAEVGFQLLKQKRYPEAQERFEAALARSPEAWIFAGLARAYQEQNRTDDYLRAARVMLEQPDQGLEHAKICDGLARYLMKRGQVDLAWPWAERGAQSWASWAMKTAWECAEMRRDWATAEAWASRQAQRYGDQWLVWLGWSLRTGHGHVAQAARPVWTQWDAGRSPRGEAEEFLVADLGLVLDRPDATRAIAERHLAEKPGSQADLILLALAADRLGDRKGRDEALDRIVADPKPAGPKTARIVQLLVNWDRHRADGTLAEVLPRVDAVLAEVPPKARPNSEFVAGMLLQLVGQPAEAVPYLKRTDVAGTFFGSRLLARKHLAECGEPLTEYLIDAPKADATDNGTDPVEL